MADATASGGLHGFLAAHPLVVLFLLLAVALRLGRVQIFGIHLGTSAVVFVALLFGHLGLRIPSGLGSLGLVLFVYVVGLEAGPGFFRAFVSRGRALAQLSVVIVGVGAAAAALFAALLDLPVAVAAGLLAGALTSTPGLAAATEAVASAGGDPGPVTVAYGLAYPFGVVAVVAAVQALPRFGRAAGESVRPPPRPPAIERIQVVVENPAVIGRPVQEIRALDQLSCQVTRRLRDGRMEPLGHDEPLEAGDELLLVVDAQEAELAVALFGARSGHRAVLDTDRERAQVVITNPELFGRTLRDLDLPSRYGVTLSRLTRYELEMVPTGDLRLRPGDQVSLVGTPEAIARFMKLAGHRTRALHETDLVSLSAALVVGLVLGVTPVILPGGEEFRLGLAGGPLFVGLLLGHFGQVGPLSGDVPRAARLLLSELGLALFLANAGVVAGRDLVATVEARGLVLALAGMGITLAALLGGWLVARRGMKLDLAAALGGLCGGMTSTPGIGALTAKGDAERAVASYAAAYPVALILMGLAAQLLVSLIA